MREIVLHVMAETATHAGHLDAARELSDGRLWLVLTERVASGGAPEAYPCEAHPFLSFEQFHRERAELRGAGVLLHLHDRAEARDAS